MGLSREIVKKNLLGTELIQLISILIFASFDSAKESSIPVMTVVVLLIET